MTQRDKKSLLAMLKFNLDRKAIDNRIVKEVENLSKFNLENRLKVLWQ